MRLAGFIALFTLSSAPLVLAACGSHDDDHDHGASTGDCGALQTACHGKSDAGSVACHDVADKGDEAACSAQKTSCLATCGGTGGSAVKVTFSAKVGSTPFSCTGSFPGLGADGATWTPRDFRLYVHAVSLHAKDGTKVPLTLATDAFQTGGIALLDFEDASGTCSNGTAETHVALTGTAPAGEYTGLSFTLGVPEDKNHLDPTAQPSPLNLSTLTWGWMGGYKFARIDGATAGTPSFNLHLGSTGCTGSGSAITCSRPNRPEITLTGKDPLTSTIVIDLAKLVAGVTLAKDAGGAPGCMSDETDPECAPIFTALGLDVASGKPGGAQTVFSFE